MIKNIEENADMLGSRAAMFRAARRACDLAIRYNHPIAISRDGKVVCVPPEEVLAELDRHERGGQDHADS